MTPVPGSPEAVARGCACPRMDNADGAGCGQADDKSPLYWIDETCPIHGTTVADTSGTGQSVRWVMLRRRA